MNYWCCIVLFTRFACPSVNHRNFHNFFSLIIFISSECNIIYQHFCSGNEKNMYKILYKYLSFDGKVIWSEQKLTNTCIQSNISIFHSSYKDFTLVQVVQIITSRYIHYFAICRMGHMWTKCDELHVGALHFSGNVWSDANVNLFFE